MKNAPLSRNLSPVLSIVRTAAPVVPRRFPGIVLDPPTIPPGFARGEAMATAAAQRQAGTNSPNTVRGWCERYGIGRKIGGRWVVSRVALKMLLAGDMQSVELYALGFRDGVVAEYFESMGLCPPD